MGQPGVARIRGIRLFCLAYRFRAIYAPDPFSMHDGIRKEAETVPGARWVAAFKRDRGIDVQIGAPDVEYTLVGESLFGSGAFVRVEVSLDWVETGFEVGRATLPDAVKKAWDDEFAKLSSPAGYLVRRDRANGRSESWFHLQGYDGRKPKARYFTLEGQEKAYGTDLPFTEQDARVSETMKEFKPDGGRFSLLMPGEPQDKVSRKKRADDSVFESHLVRSEPANCTGSA